LQELAKKTDPTHPDYSYLQKAAKDVKEIIDLINERTRVSENVQKLTEIEAKLIDSPPVCVHLSFHISHITLSSFVDVIDFVF
jgi:hypothetical protein